MNDPIRNIDDARLRPHLRAQKPTPQKWFYLAPDNGVDEVVTFNPHALASPGDLRGIPVVGKGVGGVSPGTNPESETIRKLTRDRAA